MTWPIAKTALWRANNASSSVVEWRRTNAKTGPHTKQDHVPVQQISRFGRPTFKYLASCKLTTRAAGPVLKGGA